MFSLHVYHKANIHKISTILPQKKPKKTNQTQKTLNIKPSEMANKAQCGHFSFIVYVHILGKASKIGILGATK